MNNIILIEINPATEIWSNRERKGKISGVSIGEILTKYQGYEGKLVDHYYVKDNDPDLKVVYDLFLETSKVNHHKVLYVSSAPVHSIHLEQMGYDVGICEEECIFSSIVNEILFGHVEELVAFKNVLNENFLFSDKRSAEEYVRTHNQMEALGKDVETHMSIGVHEIWSSRQR